MQTEPREPRGRPREVDAQRQLGDRGTTADRGHRALVDVAKRLGPTSVHGADDLVGSMLPDCMATGSERRQDVAVTRRGWRRCRRRRTLRDDRRCAGRGRPRCGRLDRGHRVPQRAHWPCTPAAHTSVCAASSSPPGSARASRRSDTGDGLARADVDAHLLQPFSRVVLRIGRERLQQGVAISTGSRGPAHVEWAEVLAHHHGEQFGHRAGDLDSGRSTTDDHERAARRRRATRDRRRPLRTVRGCGCAG